MQELKTLINFIIMIYFFTKFLKNPAIISKSHRFHCENSIFFTFRAKYTNFDFSAQ